MATEDKQNGTIGDSSVEDDKKTHFIVSNLANGSFIDLIESGKCDSTRIMEYLPLICDTLTNIPFFMNSLQKRLANNFFQMITNDDYLLQLFILYLHWTKNKEIIRLFSIYMNKTKGDNNNSDINDNNDENSDSSTQSSIHQMQRKMTVDLGISEISKEMMSKDSQNGNGNGNDKDNAKDKGTGKDDSKMKEETDNKDGTNIAEKGSAIPRNDAKLAKVVANNFLLNDLEKYILLNRNKISEMILFYQSIYNELNKPNDIKKVAKGTIVYDVLNGNKVDYFKCEKVMISHWRPIVVSTYTVKGKDKNKDKSIENDKSDSNMDRYVLSSKLLFKFGDNLAKDYAIMESFSFINYLWQINDLKYHKKCIQRFKYRVVPMGHNFGVLELIDNCCNLCDLKNHLKIKGKTEKEINFIKENMVRSGVASFISSFILGIGRRHYNNILINTIDGTIFDIDFGFIFGELSPMFDTPKIAISTYMVDFLGKEYWKDFINESMNAYMILRSNYKLLLKILTMAFKDIKPFDNSNTIETYLKSALKIDTLNDKQAKKYIKNKIETSPHRIKKIVSNTMETVGKNLRTVYDTITTTTASAMPAMPAMSNGAKS